MTPAVNLLPWRDGQRRRRNRLFALQLGGAVAAALAVIGSFAVHLDGIAEGQRTRNAFLRENVAEFERRIEEVERLRQRRRELTGRIEAIGALEAQRGVVARVLEEMVSTLPVGVHYRAMDLRGDVLTLRGVAASNQGVPALMRNFQQSPWFATPRLLGIQDAAQGASPQGGSAFSMTVVRVPLGTSDSALRPAAAAISATGT